ncbi:RNA pseudouridine synthase 2, chloroplastic [Aristolochia californica]|uniref:RNA pseudouridine synthase 2, chloroplastic n=1 Tax=Aristolochia californica TaxID=171875 RepID=UPI0035D6E45B
MRFSLFSLPTSSSYWSPCVKDFCKFSTLSRLRPNPASAVPEIFCFSSFSCVPRVCCFSSLSSSSSEEPQDHQSLRGNYAGVRFEEIVRIGTEKSRLDSWISSHIEGVSRARIQSSIRAGLVFVNGKAVSKVSHVIKAGDKVNCTIAELQPLSAEPEDIPLDIVYEDAHVLVVNKPAHMVVHPAPGNANGTLVNGILHHCSLPTVAFPNGDTFSEAEDCSDEEFDSFSANGNSGEGMSRSSEASVRPGIVHRLDKGTSGLLVVAKDEHSHAHLSEQFKQHSIHRIYISLTSGVPSPSSGRVVIPIARDPSNRIRMTAVSIPSNHMRARYAASRYKVVEVLGGGGSALVQWRLETGRTHQIRAHAKYLGIPLLGDETYGGTKDKALSLLRPRIPSSYHAHLTQLVSKLERPCLHAFSLGFEHPHTGEKMKFSCPPPSDFTEILSELRNLGTEHCLTPSARSATESCKEND